MFITFAPGFVLIWWEVDRLRVGVRISWFNVFSLRPIYCIKRTVCTFVYSTFLCLKKLNIVFIFYFQITLLFLSLTQQAKVICLLKLDKMHSIMYYLFGKEG